jgi:hypothetical protein
MENGGRALHIILSQTQLSSGTDPLHQGSVLLRAGRQASKTAAMSKVAFYQIASLAWETNVDWRIP